MKTIAVPDQMSHLPIDPKRGLPIPWFVPIVNGVPNWLAASGEKQWNCAAGRKCWVCGQPALARPMFFVGGPLVLCNGVTSEGWCHQACAEYSVQACPYLANPAHGRGVVDGAVIPDGYVPDHPHAVCVIAVQSVGVAINDGGLLWQFEQEDVVDVRWWCRGVRQVNDDEVDVAISLADSRLRSLAAEDVKRDPSLVTEVNARIAFLQSWRPSRAKA